ncbi:hypothetical protein JCM16303_003570 [Sporobolomyces ruberrimus]
MTLDFSYDHGNACPAQSPDGWVWMEHPQLLVRKGASEAAYMHYIDKVIELEGSGPGHPFVPRRRSKLSPGVTKRS